MKLIELYKLTYNGFEQTENKKAWNKIFVWYQGFHAYYP